jgi:hypothetical protein
VLTASDSASLRPCVSALIFFIQHDPIMEIVEAEILLWLRPMGCATSLWFNFFLDLL